MHKFIERYEYNPKTGALTYKKSVGSARKGRQVGTEHLNYRVTKVDGKHWFVHKIIWAMHYGVVPTRIDHINGDGLDNRLENLRLATPAENMWNKSGNSNKKLPKGVHPHGKKFKVCISKGGKQHYLGLYKTVDEAKEAYNTAAEALHGRFAKLNK